ncbi:flagellum-associated coiled-coil domain-containing protein 1-like isoform X2 [Ptychodera flava]|uniref:flagellum-associated coiled-coil domain-containing protein 1-like isoform X2 n=1 Tax=Ptychodera flava TaxID=63121 RepID=UPI00396A30BF
MSNFNMPSVNQPRSNLSLGGEMTNRDKMEANKYKMSGLANLHKKKNRQSEGKQRPKSTPAAINAASPEQGYDPPASAPPGIRPRCDRFHEVERDFPGRKNMLESHFPVKKTKAVQRDEEELRVRDYELAPGMTMSKSKSRVAVTINTGLIDALPRRTTESVRSADPERDALILQLQQQISDLSLYLEEERLNHKATKERAALLMSEKLEEIEQEHQREMQELQEDFEEQVEDLKTLQKKQLEQERTAAQAAQSRLKGEVEFLQGAFEAYKGNIAQEMEEKWAKKESDMKLKFQEEMEEALQEQRQEFLEEKEREKKAMSREFQRQLNLVTQDHRREMDTFHKKFSTAAVDMENMKKALDQLNSVKEELTKKSEQLEKVTSELKKTKFELQDTKIRLVGFEEHFLDKVQEVDDKYKQRMHNLMGENTDLRRRYMQKCDELFNEKSNTEVQRVEKLSNAKETMQMLIHVRNRTNVSMACADLSLDNQPKIPKLRPSSAPVTKREEKTAKLSAGETDHITNPIEKRDRHDEKLLRGRPPTRPNTSHTFRSAPPPNTKRVNSLLDSFGYGSMQSM